MLLECGGCVLSIGWLMITLFNSEYNNMVIEDNRRYYMIRVTFILTLPEYWICNVSIYSLIANYRTVTFLPLVSTIPSVLS